MLRAVAVEGERERRELEVGDSGMREGLHDPERARLLGARDVGHVGHGCGGHSCSGQHLLPLRCVALAQPCGDESDQRVAVPHAVGVRTEALVGGELRKLECVAQEPEQPVVSCGDHELAVARREHLVGSDHREAGSLPRRHGAVCEEADEVVADVAEGGLVQGRVDERAVAAALALEQGGDDAERRPHARPHVDQRRADAHARPPRLARHADEAAGRLHERVVARLGRERPDVPVSADRAVDETWVASAQRVGAEAHASREPGPEALEEHVRAVGEAEDGVPAALVAQRDGERALARVHGQEHRALAVPERRAPRTCVVPGVRPLDLDHVGAERGEDLRAVRAGDRRRHVDDARPREREERHRPIIPC